MLLSLIFVLVLLVIGFFALWTGATGRIGGGEGPELSTAGRAVVLLVALMAFGIGYKVYSLSRSGGVFLTATAPAMPSNPPETRGLKVAETTIVDPGVDVRAADTPATDAAVIAEAKPATAAATPLAAEDAMALASTEGLSAGAAALEAQALQPRRQIAPYTPVVATAAPAATTTAVKRPVVASARAPQSAGKATQRARRSYRPLTLHVQNALGPDQLREELTLSIEGKAVAEINVDGSRPAVAVAVPLPRPGLLHYRLEGISEADGTTRVVGEGCIRVRDGSRFTVRRKDGSRKVFLEVARAG